MNSIGHLMASSIKSILRLVGCGMALGTKSYGIGFLFFAIAELFGVVEEIVDKR